jgi:MarR family transcriptional regulator, lower aerobic nicotinate degradation pathway regulator
MSIVHLLHRASQVANDIFVAAVNNEITPRQYAVLAAVAEGKALSQVGIGVATGIDRSSTGELVHRLVARGYLRRRRKSRDSRLFVVRLTSKGSELVERLRPAAERADREVLDQIPKADWSKLQGLLQQMARVDEDEEKTWGKGAD